MDIVRDVPSPSLALLAAQAYPTRLKRVEIWSRPLIPRVLPAKTESVVMVSLSSFLHLDFVSHVNFI